MKGTEVKKGIYWVGAVDWNVRNFHGYLTQRGTTYNAYLIIDEKITLVDTVKKELSSEMLGRIKSIIDPSKIDYLVCNHVEMDHSGAMEDIIKYNPDMKVFTSPNGVKGLKEHYKQDWNFQPVKSGDSVSLGKRSLNFVLTPMVHWPDNMVLYMPEEKILFSNDAFGQHLSSSERFDDQYPLDTILEEARKYYANIVLPFSSQVLKVLEIVKTLDIEIIANSHGIIWRDHVDKIIESYGEWASNQTRKKALIIYDTMWKSTEKMGQAIREGFEEKDYDIRMLRVSENHISDIMTEVMDAEYICVGSPTLNKNIMPTVASFLTYLKGLAPTKRKGISFGSYGWGCESIPKVSEYLKDAKINVVKEFKQKYIPSEEDLANITAQIIEELS
ncbi:MAG: MBL fold metallo-hydrolase [Candidatus Cloacimonadota bacterium]|nr:MAG: MBL fold metallo-hydrolase [Candidatus Cloacimonadota bacterium]PIE77767.1 MAG: MBL fold metallo-hydrolase [Candidatus Delongbacteria bacterium]